jgi:hypothetical protein
MQPWRVQIRTATTQTIVTFRVKAQELSSSPPSPMKAILLSFSFLYLPLAVDGELPVDSA